MQAFGDFVELVMRLRQECPWDREQTHESIRQSMIEEAYEVVDAIDRKDSDHLKAELGDVLLNVVFHAVMAAEVDAFSIEDVIRSETQKLVDRHPHVFGDQTVEDSAAVLVNWERLKKSEAGRQSVLDGVPPALPALQLATRVQSKAARVGFDFEQIADAWSKVKEEVSEFELTVAEEPDRAEDEFGDLLFALVNVARIQGIDPESALRRTNRKFVTRFQYIESRLEVQNRDIGDATLSEMDALWEEAKSSLY